MQVCGSSPPTLKDRPQLAYIDAILCETTRIANIFPYLPEHSALKVYSILIYILPEHFTYPKIHNPNKHTIRTKLPGTVKSIYISDESVCVLVC